MSALWKTRTIIGAGLREIVRVAPTGEVTIIPDATEAELRYVIKIMALRWTPKAEQ